MVEPDLEEKKAGPKVHELDPEISYIIKEEQGKKGYEIFTDQITHEINGLCITKYPPDKLRSEYGFEKTPLIWFTFNHSSKETTIDPKKADVELLPQIETFVKKTRRIIIFIDCLDQISVVKGFEITLKLIEDIKKICHEYHSILLLSVDPMMFEKGQLSTLDEEFWEVL